MKIWDGVKYVWSVTCGSEVGQKYVVVDMYASDGVNYVLLMMCKFGMEVVTCIADDVQV